MGYHTYESSQIIMQGYDGVAVNDSTDYFLNLCRLVTSSAIAPVYITRSGTIRKVILSWYNSVDCTTENTTFAIIKNGATAYPVYVGSMANAATPQTIANLNAPVASGDYIYLKMTTPVFVTNPTTYMRCSVEIQH